MSGVTVLSGAALPGLGTASPCWRHEDTSKPNRSVVDSPVRGSHASGLAEGTMKRQAVVAVLALARADEVRFAA